MPGNGQWEWDMETDLEIGGSGSSTMTARSEPGWMPGWSLEFRGGTWAECREMAEYLQTEVSPSGLFFHPTQQDNYPFPTSDNMRDSPRKEPDQGEDNEIRGSNPDME